MKRAAGLGSFGVALWLTFVLAFPVGQASRAADRPDLGPWQFDRHAVGLFTRSQGVATDATRPGVTLYSWMLGLEWADSGGRAFRRTFAIPFPLLVEGYLHIGDVDAHGGKAYLPYEKSSGPPQIAFGVVDMASGRIDGWSVHELDAGETGHNSWVAVSPDGAWLTSGEWDDMTRIRVFSVAAIGAPSVDVAAWIQLDAPVTRVQGCDFHTAVQLVCLDDAATRQLIQIDLERPLDGADVAGHPTWLGETPVDHAVPWLANVCSAPTESEGVDVRDATLRFLTIDPCILWTHEYAYTAEE
ncbi:MAG: hypothetical protein IT198_15245 [Acidimicrobiia bacterium]|nr:hypothetical protein [Acidimicrobiia bacterium]